MNLQAKDLFQLQTELIDMKVDMSVSKSIGVVLERIDGLQRELDTRFNSLEKDMVAVKTRLGMSSETESLVKTRLIDYLFKTVWIVGTSTLAILFTLLTNHLHLLKVIS